MRAGSKFDLSWNGKKPEKIRNPLKLLFEEDKRCLKSKVMNETFRKYIREKIKNPKISSEIEKDLIFAADKFNLTGNVTLMYIYEDILNIYRCKVNTKVTPSRVSICHIGEDIIHGLKEVLRGDEKTKRTTGSLFPTLDFSDAECLIIVNCAYPDYPLRSFLQSLSPRTYFVDNKEEILTKGRIEISPDLLKRKISLPFPMNTLKGIMLNKEAVFVPMTTTTLTSTFSGTFTWGELLGDKTDFDGSFVEIEEEKCRPVKILPIIDGFGNIFVTVRSLLDNKNRTSLIGGPGKESSKISDSRSGYEKKVPKKKSDRDDHDRVDRSLDIDSIVFEQKEIPVKRIESDLPLMNEKKIKGYINVIDNVFKRMASCERIITDTNVWVTEIKKHSKQMAYINLLEHLVKWFKKGTIYEICPAVYDEISKLSDRDEGASKSAKNLILKYQNLDRVDMLNLGLLRDKKAYADEPIGYRVQQLYIEKKKFSILTNDTDALVRWVAGIKEIERNSDGREGSTIPPYILCRDLLRLYSLRGKLIARLNKIKTN